ncbi:hypothetical protein [Xanthomonas sp. BRIP62418]|uniref:hypothetical protein n=1 Tax=Xanthomonas sp. BRIP62418 TaxID=2182391 RepID=UPI001F492EA3|nr:hypothetical protein [Xanthomonas sp. BRIP62418]
MSTAPSIPASVPVDLLPASAHRLRWDMGDVLRRLDARAAVERAISDPVHPLSRQLGALLHTLRRRVARSAVESHQRVAASTTHHHPEAP